MSMYALLTKQGTASSETALCSLCFSENAQISARGAADSDVASDAEFTDCTGNDALVCRECGVRTVHFENPVVFENATAYHLTHADVATLTRMGFITPSPDGEHYDTTAFIWDDLQLTGDVVFDLFDRILGRETEVAS